MKCRNRGRIPNLFLKVLSPTEVAKAFETYTSTRPKKRLSVAPNESLPFEARVVLAGGRAFVQLAPGSDRVDLPATKYTYSVEAGNNLTLLSLFKGGALPPLYQWKDLRAWHHKES